METKRSDLNGKKDKARPEEGTHKLIRENMKCPVCLEVLLPPIYQCETGHNICSSCIDEVTECPLCKGDYGDTRNYFAEELVNSMSFPCKYEEYGCTKTLPGSELKDHQESCSFQPYRCPELACQEVAGIHQMGKHLDRHGFKVMKGDCQQATMEIQDEHFDRKTEYNPWRIYTFNREFYTVTTRLKDGVWYFWTYCLGTPRETKKFSYEIVICCAEREILYRGLVHSLRTSPEEIQASGNCLVLTDSAIKSMRTHGKVSCRIRFIQGKKWEKLPDVLPKRLSTVTKDPFINPQKWKGILVGGGKLASKDSSALLKNGGDKEKRFRPRDENNNLVSVQKATIASKAKALAPAHQSVSASARLPPTLLRPSSVSTFACAPVQKIGISKAPGKRPTSVQDGTAPSSSKPGPTATKPRKAPLKALKEPQGLTPQPSLAAMMKRLSHVKVNVTDTEQSFVAKMRDTLKCPACGETIVPPVHQCIIGHNICSKCKAVRSDCAVCRAPLGSSRNFFAEELLYKVYTRCQYSNLGCLVCLPSAQMKLHEQSCDFAPFECPLNACRKLVGPVELFYHLRSHQITLMSDEVFSQVEVPKAAPLTGSVCAIPHILIHQDIPFYPVIVRNTDGSWMFFVSTHDFSPFRYEVTITKLAKTVAFQGPVTSLRMNQTQISQNGLCLDLTESGVGNLKLEGKLNVYVRVYRAADPVHPQSIFAFQECWKNGTIYNKISLGRRVPAGDAKLFANKKTSKSPEERLDLDPSTGDRSPANSNSDDEEDDSDFRISDIHEVDSEEPILIFKSKKQLVKKGINLVETEGRACKENVQTLKNQVDKENVRVKDKEHLPIETATVEHLPGETITVEEEPTQCKERSTLESADEPQEDETLNPHNKIEDEQTPKSPPSEKQLTLNSATKNEEVVNKDFENKVTSIVSKDCEEKAESSEILVEDKLVDQASASILKSSKVVSENSGEAEVPKLKKQVSFSKDVSVFVEGDPSPKDSTPVKSIPSREKRKASSLVRFPLCSSVIGSTVEQQTQTQTQRSRPFLPMRQKSPNPKAFGIGTSSVTAISRGSLSPNSNQFFSRIQERMEITTTKERNLTLSAPSDVDMIVGSGLGSETLLQGSRLSRSPQKQGTLPLENLWFAQDFTSQNDRSFKTKLSKARLSFDKIPETDETVEVESEPGVEVKGREEYELEYYPSVGLITKEFSVEEGSDTASGNATVAVDDSRETRAIYDYAQGHAGASDSEIKMIEMCSVGVGDNSVDQYPKDNTVKLDVGDASEGAVGYSFPPTDIPIEQGDFVQVSDSESATKLEIGEDFSSLMSRGSSRSVAELLSYGVNDVSDVLVDGYHAVKSMVEVVNSYLPSATHNLEDQNTE